MILSCNHLYKSFGDKDILKDVTFLINENDRLSLVGINGVGKTTLLRLIMDELSLDDGEIIKKKDATIGYLPQQQGYHSEKTIYEELLSVKSHIIKQDEDLRKMENQITQASGSELENLLKKYNVLQTEFENGEGFTYKSKVLGVINGLGFSESQSMTTVINNLSGGQKTRVALGKLLLMEPDLLILDEPTNHLDISSVKWLENYLSSYKGSIFTVSHDRYFLDKISTKIVELDNGFATVFSGNYSDYAKKKAMLRDAQIKQYYKQQKEIKHQEAVIGKLRQFNREKSIKRAESREKMLDKMVPIEKPLEINDSMHFTLEPEIVSGKDVLNVENLSKAYEQNQLFLNLNFQIKRGQRVALIGENGSGKTTLLKIINNMIDADSGSFSLGTNVDVGYYDQEHQVLHDNKTIFDEIHDDYPQLSNTKVRNVLAAFLFTGDDVYKPVSMLSGGEKGRVSLAKLMLSKSNFLLLDEPTNHLDIASKEILENALNNYSGTVFFVSHDRYFVNKTATKILDLRQKKLLEYIGNYDYYLEKKEYVEKANLDSKNQQQSDNSKNNKSSSDSNSMTGKSNSSGLDDWKAQKELAAKIRKIKREHDAAWDLISNLEDEISKIDQEFQKPEFASNAAKLNELSKERSKKEEALESAMEKWEELAQKLDELS